MRELGEHLVPESGAALDTSRSTDPKCNVPFELTLTVETVTTFCFGALLIIVLAMGIMILNGTLVD